MQVCLYTQGHEFWNPAGLSKLHARASEAHPGVGDKGQFAKITVLNMGDGWKFSKKGPVL